MTTDSNAASVGENISAVANIGVPVPKLEKTIDLSDLGSTSVVKKMTFSPDGRYLAIVDNPTHMQTDVVVWDLQLNRKQSHIHCSYDYGDLSDHDLLWSRDGKIISFGAKRQWDPMTGNDLADNPAIGRAARLNKDGSKMLTIVGTIGAPSVIHVYNTNDWSLKKIDVDGLFIQNATWTAEDRIIVQATVTKDSYGKLIDGRRTNWEDIGYRLIDPSEHFTTKAVWFPSISSADPKLPWSQTFPVDKLQEPNFKTNKIASALGKIIDGATLEISSYRSYEANDPAPGAFGLVFSPNGRLLFLKGASYKHGGHAPVNNTIVDVASGKPVSQFSGALDNQGGIAISSDGIHLALGNGQSIQIFSL